MSKQPVMTLREKMDAVKGGTGYVKMYKCLLSSTAFVNPVTEEIVEWSLTEKVLYMYLVDKVSFYLSLNKEMLETFSYIGGQIGVSTKTVQRAVRRLIDGGAIEATLASRAKGYVYTDVAINLTLVTPESRKQEPGLAALAVNPAEAKETAKPSPTPVVVKELKIPPAVEGSGTKATPIEEHALAAQEFPEVEVGTFEPDYSTMPDRSDDSGLPDLPKMVPGVIDYDEFTDEFLDNL